MLDRFGTQRDPGEVTRRVRRVVRVGDVLSGGDGHLVAERVIQAVSDGLEHLCRGLDGAMAVALLRHVSAGPWHTSPDSFAPTMGIAETAVHRWARWTHLEWEAARGFSPIMTAAGADLIVAASRFNDALVARRRIAKGQAVMVTGVQPLGFEDRGDRVQRLIEIRDRRVQRDRNVLAPASGLHVPDDDAWLSGIVAAERTTPQEAVEAARSGAWAVIELGQLVGTTERTEQLGPLDEDLRGAEGFGFADVDAVLLHLSDDMRRRFPEPPRSLGRHGLVGLPAPTTDTWDAIATATADASVTGASVAKAARALDAGRAKIPPGRWRHRPPLRVVGDRLLYDATRVATLPSFLVEREIGRPARAALERRFEHLVHQLIGREGTQPWGASKRVRRPDRSDITDCDASVLLANGDFVVCDCYAPAWSAELDDGSFTETTNRAGRVVEKLRDWDVKWREIVSTPGVLPPGVHRVVPLVVTSTPEWIDTVDDDVWVDRVRPRVSTPHEVMDLLAEVPTLVRPWILGVS